MTDTSNEYIPSAVMYQELERLKFAQDLRKNPSEYSAYVNQRINDLSNEIFNRKRAAFQKAHIDLGRYMDMDHNANFYKARNADVDRMSSSIEESNNRLLQSVTADKDITKRQFEINEWYYYNKLETLFVLQLLFIAVLSGAVIIYAQKNALITSTMAALLTGILVVVVVATGLYRYFYTSRTRDPRLWHRRYFDQQVAPPKPAASCDAGGDIVFDINAVLPKAATECADSAAQRFNAWQDSMEKEIATYQATGATPATSISTGGLCSVKV